jgi:hypothetical protein
MAHFAEAVLLARELKTRNKAAQPFANSGAISYLAAARGVPWSLRCTAFGTDYPAVAAGPKIEAADFVACVLFRRAWQCACRTRALSKIHGFAAACTGRCRNMMPGW